MRLASEAETEAFGRRIGALLAPGDAVALSGALGAGKTVLARGMLRGLGYAGEVASPTFPILLPYDPPDTRIPVAHVDLYRIERPDELAELALDEMLEQGALLIEWPERLPALWPETLQLRLAADGDARALTAKVPPAWDARWPPR